MKNEKKLLILKAFEIWKQGMISSIPNPKKPKNKLEKKTTKFSMLIIGGSQGAKKFDNLFKNDLIKLSKNFRINLFHQTSKLKETILIELIRDSNTRPT